ncbi:type IV toxin-antitoxin system AbiEi family antitoxin domain-containing protein [Longimicrobium sp.]|uniref:type IV toxin-antitoxin system AbiEi family antitoxin domain-containing protein n=1 Tax=Longimicrobium sp. TaxID=2029185 RepID=UPI002B99A14A|nr:type IV toxin-antitoxin system AbiEi family antitoxin [Longimicrobium sp.]HSU17948.1 type IV toxin-antitoxin system AbiEi family antitoxin [Longimicrobium sp.]
MEEVQASGRYFFADEELNAKVSLTSPGMRGALARLLSARRITRPLRNSGFFIIVPAEFRTRGAPPLTWYLDGLMRSLEVPTYYVGLLTAAEWHGASHYAAQETQIVSPRQIRPITIGRERLRFIRKATAAETPVEEKPTEVAPVRLSTAEATAYDLVRYVRAAGGLSVVATALAELALRPAALEQALDAGGEVAVAQRLGYLLERVGRGREAGVAERWLSRRDRVRTSALVPSEPAGGAPLAQRWNLLVNAEFEVAA